jgi:hypothetical protein
MQGSETQFPMVIFVARTQIYISNFLVFHLGRPEANRIVTASMKHPDFSVLMNPSAVQYFHPCNV